MSLFKQLRVYLLSRENHSDIYKLVKDVGIDVLITVKSACFRFSPLMGCLHIASFFESNLCCASRNGKTHETA